MTAEIITIGDEILIGQTVNSNAAAIGEQLHRVGIEVGRMVVVSDDHHDILRALRQARDEADLIITTGGLGPTHDDITREAVAAAFETDLEIREELVEAISNRYKSRGRDVPESVRIQATVPTGFDVLNNDVGTAPGFCTTWDISDERRGFFASLPGVPAEMQAMLVDEVIPRLSEVRDLRQIRSRMLLTTGIGESVLQEKIRDLVPSPESGLRLAYLPNAGGVRLRLTAVGDDPNHIDEELDALEAALRERLEEYVYGIGDENLESAVGRILSKKKLTIATAESCTGGLIANRISDISGASTYFLGAIVAYCNSVKMHALGVDVEALDEDGAVSETVALQMARGVRERLGADIGVSTTGIAGPTGGTPDKPVGTVWVAYSGPDGETAVLLKLVKHRGLNKELTTTAVLDLVRRRILALDVEADVQDRS
jgi:nicotinamide-nucleotide amidase